MPTSSRARSGPQPGSSSAPKVIPVQLSLPVGRADSEDEYGVDEYDDSDDQVQDGDRPLHHHPDGSGPILSAEDDEPESSSTPRKRNQDTGTGPSKLASSSASASAAASKARATSAAAARKRKRVSRACDQCWVRKDKCDGTSPACSICARLARDCTYTRPEKKRGPQQGVRGRLEAQCAALECVLGWILTCAEREAYAEASSSSSSYNGFSRQQNGAHHHHARNRGDIASQFPDESKTTVQAGTLVRLLLQPASIATSAAWSPNLGLPPPDSSLSSLAQHWRKSVLATYLTSPLAPSSPGLAIGLEGAAAVADGLDIDLASRQANGEAGLLGSADDLDSELNIQTQTGSDLAHRDWVATPSEAAAAGVNQSKVSMRPPGKTRRTLGPVPTPRKVAANPAAAFPPVSRGPPPTRRLHRDDFPDVSPDRDGAGLEASGISDVWASPTHLSVSLPTPASHDRDPDHHHHHHDGHQQSLQMGPMGRLQHSGSSSQQPRSPATEWVTTLHAEHQELQNDAGGGTAPHVTSSATPALPATHSQQFQDSWSAMFSAGTSAETSSALPAGAQIPATSLSFMTPFDPAAIAGPSNSLAHRESFSFTDPDAQALLYALGLSVGGVGDQGSTADSVSPGMSQTTPSVGHVSRPSQAFLPVSSSSGSLPSAFPARTSGQTQDAPPNPIGRSFHHETAKRGDSQTSVDLLDAYISPWEALDIPVSTAGTVAPSESESFASKYLQSSVGPMQPFDDQAGATAPSIPAGRRIRSPAGPSDSAGASHASVLFQLGLQEDAFQSGFHFPLEEWMQNAGTGSAGRSSASADPNVRMPFHPPSDPASGPVSSASKPSDRYQHRYQQQQQQHRATTSLPGPDNVSSRSNATAPSPPNVSATLRNFQLQAAEFIRRDPFAPSR